MTNNDSAYQTALDLKAAGIDVVAVIDAIRGGYIADDATLSGFTVTNGHTMAYGNLYLLI